MNYIKRRDFMAKTKGSGKRRGVPQVTPKAGKPSSKGSRYANGGKLK